MEQIFAVVHGYDYEGETIQKLFRNRNNAEEYLTTYKSSLDQYDSRSWIYNDSYLEWERGSEYLKIDTYEIED